MQATSAEVEVHAFDLSSPGAADELAALAKQADAMVHLAWEPQGKDNLTVLRHVLDAATAIEPAQLVHLSSGTVYGAWPDNAVPLTEETSPRPNPKLGYAVEKRAAEVVVEQWAEDHPEVAVALLRPACTVGSPEQPLYRALAAGKRPPLGGEGRLVQYLHVDDLATAVVHTCEQGLSGTFNVSPDSGVRAEVAGALAGGIGHAPAARAAAGYDDSDELAPVAAGRAAWGQALRREHLGDRGRQAAVHGMDARVQLRAGSGGQRRAGSLVGLAPQPSDLGHSGGGGGYGRCGRGRRRYVVAKAPLNRPSPSARPVPKAALSAGGQRWRRL